MRILRAIAIGGALVASFILAVIAAKSFTRDGIRFHRETGDRGFYGVHVETGVTGARGQIELQWRERTVRSSNMHNGPAVFLYPDPPIDRPLIGPALPPAPRRSPPPKAKPVLEDLGFTWYAIQPHERYAALTWHLPYKVAAPAWFVLPLSLVLPIRALLHLPNLGRRFVAAGRRAEGRCATCGYDLRATPERCPECGSLVSSRGASARIMRRPTDPLLPAPSRPARMGT